MTTAGINQPTAGTKMSGKKEAAYSPVILNLSLCQQQKAINSAIVS
jgi:hypothetical protein